MLHRSAPWLCATLLFSLFLLSFAANGQTWQWAVAPSGTNGYSQINGAVADGTGNTFVVGDFNNAVTFGSTTLVSPAGIFVARLNSVGAWTQVVGVSSGTNSTIESRAVAIDGGGNVIVTGNFIGTVSFGGTTLTSPTIFGITKQAVFVARMNSSGNWIQAVQCGSQVVGGQTEVAALAVDVSGNAVITGTFTSNTMAFGALTITNADAGSSLIGSDIFVARLSSAGNWTQAVRAGGIVAPGSLVGTEDAPTALALDANGTVVIAGYFTGATINFGTTIITTANSTGGSGAKAEVFVAKLNSAGIWTQATRGNGIGDDRITALALASNGDAIIAGFFDGLTSEFGTSVLVNAGSGSKDLFVARLNSAGSWTQAVRGGGNGIRDDDRATALAVDGSGNVIVSGRFSGLTTTLGTITLNNTSVYTLFVARLNSSGIWTQAVGAAPGISYSSAILVDGLGNATLAGYFSGPSTTFGTTTLLAVTQSCFVARLTGINLAITHANTTESVILTPNPASTTVTLTLPVDASSRTVFLYDALGRVILSQTILPYTTKATIDITGVLTGIYSIRCNTITGHLIIE